MRQLHTLLLLGVLSSAGCDFDDTTNPNSPDPIGENPSREDVANAATGMLLAFRTDFADYPLDLGIIGREVLRFDGSDPRFTGELLLGPLDPGSDAFGGDHWADQYAAIRGGNMMVATVPSSTDLSDAEKSAAAGFVKTIQALNYLLILNSHTQDSIPIVTDTAVAAPPAAFETRANVFAHVVSLLDGAVTDLQAGGAAFPFSLPSGFAGFNTPANFILFNRALRARVAIYTNDFAGALTALAASFVDVPGPLGLGVYMDYGTGAGDTPNPLSIDPQQGENFAHPSLETGAQLQIDGVTLDQRFVDKIVPRPISSNNGLISDLGWIRYPSPGSPIPIIKKEELLLLRAEANIGLSNLPAALPDINTVRTISGNLAPLGDLGTPEAALNELLYNKLYSLMFEGAHRWIDARHYERLDSLPVDRDNDVVFPTLPIPTDETLPRQPAD
jgi:hypothetical protein